MSLTVPKKKSSSLSSPRKSKSLTKKKKPKKGDKETKKKKKTKKTVKKSRRQVWLEQEIDKFVKSLIVGPLCRALNRRVASVIGRMHLGSYMQPESSTGGLDDDGPSFVQKYLL